MVPSVNWQTKVDNIHMYTYEEENEKICFSFFALFTSIKPIQDTLDEVNLKC